jgi:2-keto-4-pentenoate hydratase
LARQKLGEYGRQLRAGDIVMTGSFVHQFHLTKGDIAVAEYSGVGRVEMGIAAAQLKMWLSGMVLSVSRYR